MGKGGITSGKVNSRGSKCPGNNRHRHSSVNGMVVVWVVFSKYRQGCGSCMGTRQTVGIKNQVGEQAGLGEPCRCKKVWQVKGGWWGTRWGKLQGSGYRR